MVFQLRWRNHEKCRKSNKVSLYQWFNHSLRTGIYRAFRYHVGSIALGSLVLSITYMIRAAVYVASYVVSVEAGGDEDGTAAKIKGCTKCCLACWERTIKFLTEAAYIRMALTGENFCSATASAFFTVLKNVGRYTAVEGLGSLLINLGSISISLFSTYCGYLYITKREEYSTIIHEHLFPTAVKIYIYYI